MTSDSSYLLMCGCGMCCFFAGRRCSSATPVSCTRLRIVWRSARSRLSPCCRLRHVACPLAPSTRRSGLPVSMAGFQMTVVFAVVAPRCWRRAGAKICMIHKEHNHQRHLRILSCVGSRYNYINLTTSKQPLALCVL